MTDNVMTDNTLLSKAVQNDQDAVDALDRLMQYVHTLEVQVGYLTSCIDQFQDDRTVQSELWSSRLRALRELVADAERDVEDNYGLLRDERVSDRWTTEYIAQGKSTDILSYPDGTFFQDKR
jgi:isochorismate hydrolase